MSVRWFYHFFKNNPWREKQKNQPIGDGNILHSISPNDLKNLC
jgi:hypothetical protein